MRTFVRVPAREKKAAPRAAQVEGFRFSSTGGGGRGEATENEVGDLSALEKRPEKGEK